ncbi:hypothetical protein PENTCL1PPCAC_14723, partial [Pristionchus entomophagus]
RRSHFNKYSLNRAYQLKENLVILKLVASIAFPGFLLAVPCFVLFALYRALPHEFSLTKHICVAVYDIWIEITAGAAISVFPFADNRFRKVVARIPV